VRESIYTLDNKRIAMLDTDTGEFIEKALAHEGEELRKFYSGLTRPVLVVIILFSTVAPGCARPVLLLS
jgi:hypothetical protein